MDMGVSKRRLSHTHTHTHSGVGGRQDVCLQTIAICKQTLKPTSWISNAVGERVGGKGRTRTSLGTCICLDPRASRPIRDGRDGEGKHAHCVTAKSGQGNKT